MVNWLKENLSKDKIINLIKSKNFRTFVITFVFAFVMLIPYYETGIIRKYLTLTNKYVIPSPIIIMLFFSFVSLLYFNIYKKSKVINYYFWIPQIIYIIVLFELSLFHFFGEPIDLFLTHLSWITVPMYFAYLFIHTLDELSIDYVTLIKTFIYLFVIYLVFVLIVNFVRFGYKLQSSTTINRLYSPGGGPVILGYTITLVCSTLYCFKSSFSKYTVFFLSLFFLTFSIFTGSRGSIWPIVILFLFYIIRIDKKKISLYLLLLSIVIYIIFQSKLMEIFPRVFDKDPGLRFETLQNSFHIYFYDFNFLEKLIGKGLGQLFPYNFWSWYQYKSIRIDNMFVYNGTILLVQPHNTWLYLILETGFLGLFIFLLPFIEAIYKLLNKEIFKNLELIVFIITILLLNSLDSIFMVQPGAAAQWWILFFIIYNISIKKGIKNDEKDNACIRDTARSY